MVRKADKRKKEVKEVLEKIRAGSSLYAACEAAGISTCGFYEEIFKDNKVKQNYLLALSDYADCCTDDIREIANELKDGIIDNSTAKLLIETKKWLAQKACNNPLMLIEEKQKEDVDEEREIEVKFI